MPQATKLISKRGAAAFIALAAAVAAPVAVAASSSSSAPAVAHVRIERSGTQAVSGYDGGVAVAPGGSGAH